MDNHSKQQLFVEILFLGLLGGNYSYLKNKILLRYSLESLCFRIFY